MVPKIMFALLIAAIPLAALGQTPQPSPAPAPTAALACESSASPMPSPAPSPTISPVPPATTSPASLPTPLVLPPGDPPQILAVAINCLVFHSGDIFAATVITSTNVPAVELRAVGKVVRFQRIDFGIWQLNYKLPHIPRRFLRDYAVQIVAWNTTNLTATRDTTLSLR